MGAVPLQLNDGPTAACPPGGKTLLREEGSPRALMSLKLAVNNRSNLVSSSVKCSPPPSVPPPPTPPDPPSCSTTSPGSECPRPSGARQQRPIVVFRVHLADVFLSLSLEFLHFPNVRRKLVSSYPGRELHFNNSGLQQKTHPSYLQEPSLFQTCSNEILNVCYEVQQLSLRVHPVITLLCFP